MKPGRKPSAQGDDGATTTRAVADNPKRAATSTATAGTPATAAADKSPGAKAAASEAAKPTGGKSKRRSSKRGYLDGQMLIAMPSMGDERFARSVIYMCAHSSDGWMGIIV